MNPKKNVNLDDVPETLDFEIEDIKMEPQTAHISINKADGTMGNNSANPTESTTPKEANDLSSSSGNDVSSSPAGGSGNDVSSSSASSSGNDSFPSDSTRNEGLNTDSGSPVDSTNNNGSNQNNNFKNDTNNNKNTKSKPENKNNQSRPQPQNKNNANNKNNLNKGNAGKNNNIKTNNKNNNPKRPSNGSLRDRAASKGADMANRLKDKVKNNAKNNLQNKVQNSKPMQAYNKARNAAQKARNAVNNAKKAAKAAKKAVKVAAKAAKAAAKAAKSLIQLFVSTLPWSLIVVGVILVIVVMIAAISAIGPHGPGGSGDGNGDDSSSTLNVEEIIDYYYAKKDAEIMKLLKSIYDKYPNSDAALAMVIVEYPYYDALMSSDTKALVHHDEAMDWDGSSSSNLINLFKSVEDYEDEDDSEDNDSENTDDLEEDDSGGRDIFLIPFEKWYFRHKFKKVLKIIDGAQDEDDAINKIIEKNYIPNQAGYRYLFSDTSDPKNSNLMESIKKDLKDNKKYFEGYIFKNNCLTTANTQSVGQITVDYTNNDNISLQDLLTKNIVVDVKKEGCTETGKLTSCQSIYSSPIPMEKYIIGVTIQEVGESLTVDKFAANMIAEKSFAIGRAYSRGNVSKIDNDTYAIGIIDSTRDQAYCDYETLEWCSSGKSKLSDEQLSTLTEAWEKTQNTYLWNGKNLMGSVCQNQSYASACSCSAGKCLFQEEVENGYTNQPYETILMDQFKNSNPALLVKEGNYLSMSVGSVSNNCTGTPIGDENFIYYSQQDYPNTAFCHRTLTSSNVNYCSHGNSICTSGCGVTSTAMVLATLLQNTAITPETINSETISGTDCGDYGSIGDNLIPNMAKKYGLTSSKIGLTLSNAEIKEKIQNALDTGSLVIANVDGSFGDGVYKTGGGHFTVIRGYTGDTAYMADPAQTRTMNSYCELRNEKGQCTKVRTSIDNLISNVKAHGMASFHVVSGGTPFLQDNNINVLSGDGVTTGYLKSPLGPNMTSQQTKTHANCGGLYYCGSRSSYHGAIDFGQGVSTGDPIYAMDGGIVETSKLGGDYGNYIVIRHTANNKTYYTLYAHLSKRIAQSGDKVSQGQKIGELGNTGNSTGPHLHAELISSTSCLGHKCFGVHYNILKYIGLNKTYIGQKCDGKGC